MQNEKCKTVNRQLRPEGRRVSLIGFASSVLHFELSVWGALIGFASSVSHFELSVWGALIGFASSVLRFELSVCRELTGFASSVLRFELVEQGVGDGRDGEAAVAHR
jgi:ferritin-like metal-binding protein YciE